MGNSFKALQSSGAMKGIAAGVNSFNNTRQGLPAGMPADPSMVSGPSDADMDELLKKLAKYFPQQQTPQTGPVKVGQ